MLGEILHDVMRKLYSDFTGRSITVEMMDHIIGDKQSIETVIADTISEKFSGEAERTVEGTEYIVRDVLMAYVLKILRTDKSLAPFKILHLESVFSFQVSFASGDSVLNILAGG
ncbi:MAG: hypothetical protein IPJ37_04760 [Bacteroidales bacterium]|nr:hypothetical protein [Bacteroidales bacterium]